MNTDPPHLSKLWNEHHAASLSSSRCSVHLWDQCILSKIYFHPEHLLLALDEVGAPLGFIHFGPGMRGTPWTALSNGGDSQVPGVGMVHALCVARGAEEDRIAGQLIAHAVGSMRSTGHARLLALGSLASSIFYLGIADGDNLMGVVESDERTHAWLRGSGFRDVADTDCWELALDAFRPPVDRHQIAIRRSCSISRILEESHPNWWISSVLGHCDQSRFHLVTHGADRTEIEILYWYPDATLRGVDSSIARLSLPPLPADESHRERLVCLIAESARQLQQERKRSIRVVTLRSDATKCMVLERLGFRVARKGREMEFASDHDAPAVPSTPGVV